MRASFEPVAFTADPRAISRLNRPTQELVLAAHRERGVVLRTMVVEAVRRVSHAFSERA